MRRSFRRRLFSAALVLVVLTLTALASAHGMRTAYIEIDETVLPDGTRQLTTRVTSGASFGGVHLVMPAGCALRGDTGRVWTCRDPLAGSTLRVDGLGGVVADAVVAVTLADGARESQLLRAHAATWTVPARPRPWEALLRYARAGFWHVLAGADHLLFLAALVVALRRFRAVVLAETAFTLSHSIAFTATALGWIHVPAAAAEAAIALSLVLVALDAGRRRLTPMAGARAALLFGAVHGLGFAGGLEELGMPRTAIGPALLGFAAGVELAQVLFLFAVFALLALARRPLSALTPYLVGAAGTFWLIERTVALVP